MADASALKIASLEQDISILHEQVKDLTMRLSAVKSNRYKDRSYLQREIPAASRWLWRVRWKLIRLF